MKQATVTTEFPGRPDNAEKVRTIAVGETIDGDLAEVAIRQGWATEVVATSGPTASTQPARKPLAEMSLLELKTYAVDKRIDLGQARKHADVLAVIERAEQGKA